MGAAFCWAQNSVSYSITGKRVSSQTVAHIRLWISLPLIVLVHYIFCSSFLPQSIDSDDFYYLALSGFTGFFITDVCLFKTFVDLGPREGMVIMCLSPILSFVFAWIFLDEHLTILQIIGILITVAGVAWVILEEHQKEIKNPHLVEGVIVGLTAAVMQAVSLILAKKGMSEATFTQSISGNLIRVFFGLAGLVAFAMLRKNFILDFKKMKDYKTLSIIALAAFVGPVVGMIASLYALTLAKVGIVTTLMQLSPIILIPVEVFIFKKKLGKGAVLGTLLAVLGAAMLFLLRFNN